MERSPSQASLECGRGLLREQKCPPVVLFQIVAFMCGRPPLDYEWEKGKLSWGDRHRFWAMYVVFRVADHFRPWKKNQVKQWDADFVGKKTAFVK